MRSASGRFFLPMYVKCDKQCQQCRWRFECFTNRNLALRVVPTAEELEYYRIIATLEAKNKRAMLCPYCEEIFVISQQQITHNMKFKCWSCGKFNYGSVVSDKFGILVGAKEIIGW